MRDSEFEALLAKLREAMAKLSPQQLDALKRETAIDWAYGQLMATTNHREGVTRETIAALYDAKHQVCLCGATRSGGHRPGCQSLG